MIYDISNNIIMEKVIRITQTKHFLLTRKEILKFIIAEGGVRAEGIQKLLNLKEIEIIRKNLVTIKNEFENEKKNSFDNLEKARASVNATLKLSRYTEKKVLEEINKYRKTLNGNPIKKLESKIIKVDLVPPALKPISKVFNYSNLQQYIGHLKNSITNIRLKELIGLFDTFNIKIKEISEIPRIKEKIKAIELITLGITLIPETGECPLCDNPWQRKELKQYLENKKSKLVNLSIKFEETENLAKKIKHIIINDFYTPLNEISNIIKETNKVEKIKSTNKWLDDVNNHLQMINNSIEIYKPICENSSQFINRLVSKDRITLINEFLIDFKLEKTTLSPQQHAWDTITRLEVKLKTLERDDVEFRNKNLFFSRAQLLLSKYEKVRDKVLEDLYERIQERFVRIYSRLHQEDENNFKAAITPDKAAVKLLVDFYGRGNFPPIALHSEGHQDSMGLCLFFALSEELTEGTVDLVLLDDVVMSIDANHRKQICNLLTNEFKDKQYVITTHDKVWAMQLRKRGVIPTKNLLEFAGWDINTGPYVNDCYDMWLKIEKDLLSNDISAASHCLRRGLEQFYSYMCDYLEAKVKFNFEYQWTLGDLLPSAYSRYKSLIKKAKISAESWKKETIVKNLGEEETKAKKTYLKTKAEDWILNTKVHFNSWENFTKNDFIGVVNAFKELESIFMCVNCGGIITLLKHKTQEQSVKCNCGEKSWNLTKNKSAN